LVATGLYLVRPGDSPWRVAERVYGSGARHGEIVAANVSLGVMNPGERWEVPGYVGADVVVKPGEGPWAITSRVLQRTPSATDLERFQVWNGGDRVLHPGERVFVEAR
jgi:hypothetical protein